MLMKPLIALGFRNCQRAIKEAASTRCLSTSECVPRTGIARCFSAANLSAGGRPFALHNPLLNSAGRDTPTSLAPAITPSASASHNRFLTSSHRPSFARPFPDWEAEPLPALYELLLQYATQARVSHTKALAEYLVRHRGEGPNSRLYSALILCNVDPEHGSVTAVRDYLRELEDEGISIDSGICHNVIKVLAVHVDHSLRADILLYMRKAWFTLSAEGYSDVAVGLLREGSVEAAQQIISSLRSKGESIPDWVGHLSAYSLLHAGEIAGALDELITYGTLGDATAPAKIGQVMLDVGSSMQHYPGTLHAWNTQERLGRANASTGTLTAVLRTAAQHGDIDLAIEAFRRLGQQAISLSCTKYELLCHAYLSKQPVDLFGALSTASTMAEAGIPPNRSFTRLFYAAFERDAQQALRGFELMQELHRNGRMVPLTIINALLEAHAAKQDVEQAMAVYQAMHHFERYGSPDQPRRPFANLDTYEILYGLVGTVKHNVRDLVISLRDEQTALGVVTSQKMLDGMLAACINGGDIDYAKTLLQESNWSGLEPRTEILQRVLDILAHRRDGVCWDLVRKYSTGGDASRAWEERLRRLWAESPPGENHRLPLDPTQ
ncbi:Hypothetical protein D9617_30g011340 [Elsinoe fawcettii]|nr:Hypothetical protein D9617_30g011340 [Elsinoe fawcettii]